MNGTEFDLLQAYLYQIDRTAKMRFWVTIIQTVLLVAILWRIW